MIQAETMRPRTDSRGVPAWQLGLSILLMAVAVGSAYAVWQAPTNLAKGGASLVLMLALMLLRVPVGAAMGAAGLAGLVGISGSWGVAWQALREMPFGTASSWSLSVLPMFILMGLLLWRAGVTERLYDAARLWLGWLPGGLAVTTNAAGGGLAAASGSTLGITYALARIGIPEMLRSGYDRRLAVGSVLMAGTGGNLIPPSILLVVYAGVAQTAVGPQLLAGLIPGIVLHAAYGLLIVTIAVVRPAMAPRDQSASSVSWAERLRVLRHVWAVPALAGIVLGGLYSGVFTATEAGAFGAAAALVVAVIYVGPRRILRVVFTAARDTTSSLAGIMFLLIGAAMLGRLLAISGIAREVAEAIAAMGLTRWQLLLLLTLMYLVLGMFLEPIAMILLTVPILLPMMGEMGVSSIWFGVFVVLMAEISVLTPPVGILAFVVHRIAQDPEVNRGTRISLRDVFLSAGIYIPVSLLVLVLLVVFPQLVEWLPGLAAG